MKHSLLAFLSRAALGLALLPLSVGVVQGQAPITVTIGTGTTAGSTNVLLSTSTTANKYARTASIYSAEELRAAGARPGSFTRIAWFKGGTGEYTTGDARLAIYFKRTTAAAFSVNPVVWDTEVIGATAVYSNTMLSLPTGTGWKEFVLTAPFVWNGTDNIEVLVDWFRSSTPTADISWQYTAVITANGTHATQVNSMPIPTVRWAANRPNVRFQLTSLVSATRTKAPADWVQVSPNPFTQDLTVKVGAGGQHLPVEATLTDALGRTHYQQQLPAGAERKLPLPATLAAGLYFLTLRNEQWQQTQRLVRE